MLKKKRGRLLKKINIGLDRGSRRGRGGQKAGNGKSTEELEIWGWPKILRRGKISKHQLISRGTRFLPGHRRASTGREETICVT